jgi:TctA family transporter
MALLLGALMIQGIVLVRSHQGASGYFLGLVRVLIGNIMLVLLNVPLIDLGEAADDPVQVSLSERCSSSVSASIKRQQRHVPGRRDGRHRHSRLCAARLGFHPAPILLGFVLGPRFEENFRRAMLISRGDILVFVERPISAVFIGLCVLLIALQIYVRIRGTKPPIEIPTVLEGAA